MKYTLVFLLCALALIVVFMMIIPAAANLILGAGIELPGYWTRFVSARFI